MDANELLLLIGTYADQINTKCAGITLGADTAPTKETGYVLKGQVNINEIIKLVERMAELAKRLPNA
jgi:hypothetical protein